MTWSQGLRVIAVLAVIAGWIATSAPSRAQQTPTLLLPQAHGVAVLPSDGAGRIAWRVVADRTDTSSGGAPIQRALGFVLALDAPVLVSDETSGVRDLVPAGGAAFVPSGATEIRTSTTASPASYLRIGLVAPDEAASPADGRMVLAGAAFAAPEGPRSIVLAGASLASGEALVLPASEHPAVIVITRGSVSGDGVVLGAGQAQEFTGAQHFRAGEGGATVAVLSIGAVSGGGETPSGSGDAPATIAPAASPIVSPTATPDRTGAMPTPTDDGLDVAVQLHIEAYDCTEGDASTGEGCTLLPGVTFTVERSKGAASSETAMTTDANGEINDRVQAGGSLRVTYLSGAPDGLVPVEVSQERSGFDSAVWLSFFFVPAAS